MKLRTLFALSPIVFVTGLWGCSSSSSSSSPESSAAAAYCAVIEQCDPVGLNFSYGSTAACEQAAVAQVQALLALPGVSETAASLSACLTATAAQGCAGYEGAAPLPAACNTKPGTLADGAACAHDEQCAGLSCQGANGSDTSCGSCQTVITGIADGATCSMSIQCTSRLCYGDGTCADLLGAGASCAASNAFCGFGLTCSSANICVASGEAGDACATDADCDALANNVCGSGGTCVAATWTYVPVGAACNPTARTQCAYGGGCFNGVCVADATAGQACSAGNGPGCDATSTCTTFGSTTGSCVALASACVAH